LQFLVSGRLPGFPPPEVLLQAGTLLVVETMKNHQRLLQLRGRDRRGNHEERGRSRSGGRSFRESHLEVFGKSLALDLAVLSPNLGRGHLAMGEKEFPLPYLQLPRTFEIVEI